MWKANLKFESISSFLGRRKSSSTSATSTSTSVPSSSQTRTSNETSTDSDLKVSRDADLDNEETEEKTAGEIEEEERREVIRQNQIKSELSKLPKVGTTAAHKKGEKHGLTPIQVDRKIQELSECIKRGKTPSKCKSCKQTKAYMYNSFYKRGGTKKLYCCANCFNHWSDFYCAEEDYDFLSG